ncbi:MAG: TolC family protein, partial [Desulfobacteraceae bacterium]|nr:TolC family protein [Desulfobacteraceae bacterium]
LLPPLQASAQQAMHGLAILLGQAPEALTAELSPTAALPEPPATPPAGLPSDLLRRRPDIRQAEANIHAATARIGVAEADLFPKLNLTGAISLQGDAINSWFNWTNRLWSLGPSASWQLFDSGRIKANVMQQQSVKDQSLIAYRQTVLSALQEVEDALVAVNREREHQQALRQAREADQRALNLARDLYTSGQTDFTSVLLAEQALYAADDALTQSTKALATNLVALYKALGGGWQTSG